MFKKLFIAILAAAAFTLAADPITVEARLTEIPGKMPSNDLYSYVYVFKYKVQKVVSGKLDANPRTGTCRFSAESRASEGGDLASDGTSACPPQGYQANQLLRSR